MKEDDFGYFGRGIEGYTQTSPCLTAALAQAALVTTCRRMTAPTMTTTKISETL